MTNTNKEDFILNSIIIDIIFIAFLAIMSFFGYKKGFITRLYDVLTIILVLFLSFVLANPLSHIISIFPYNKDDLIANVVGSTINLVIVFIVIFIVLFIIKKIIGVFVKPTLKSIMNKFSMTSFVDKTLGIVLSLIEAIFIAYIILVFVFIPFYDNQAKLVNQTIFAKQVVQLVPEVTEDVMQFADAFNQVRNHETSSYSLQSLTQLLIMAQDFHLLSDEQLQTIVKENLAQELKKEKISLSLEEKQQIEDLLLESGYNTSKIKEIIQNINVRD